MQVFTRDEFEQAEKICLQRGRWGNADVWRVALCGHWVVKDFRRRRFCVRCIFGAWMVFREHRVLRKLAGITAIPEEVFKLDRYALCESFGEGQPLNQLGIGVAQLQFFERLETAVQAMHAAGVVHLDLRNAGNILMCTRQQPLLIDFQSAMYIGWMPAVIRRRLQWIDLSGVYKHWARLLPDTLGEERERVLLWQLRNRKWWRIRGYRLSPVHRSLKKYERELLKKYSES